MAEPASEMAADAGGYGHLRASHAEREQAIGLLKAAFVQGRLAKDEFDLRVGQALTSRTRAELADLTADIPAGLTVAPPTQPAKDEGAAKVAVAVTCVFAAWWSIVVGASFWMSDNGSAQRSPGALIVILVLYASIVWVWLIAAWLGRRARRRSAREQSPGRGGQRPRRPVPADSAGGPASGVRSPYREPSIMSRYAISYFGPDGVSRHGGGPR
jgi:hypothetical protein